jgi:iron complex outermembrane recepter protein
MKKIIFVSLLSLFSFNILIAQSGGIKGKITDGSKPLELANIGFPEINIGTTTDSKGEYHINNIPVGEYKLSVQLLGYKRTEQTITIQEGITLEMNFSLTIDNLLLNELVIIDEQTGLTNRTPYSISRIDAKQVEFKGNPSGIMGFLKEDPGVYGAEMGQGIVKPFVRGLGFSRVVTIYQGNKLENHQWGTDHGLGLNDVGIGNIEIIKGPASILYGSGAIGGVILIKDNEQYLHTTQLTGEAGATFNTVSGGYRPYLSLGKSFQNGFFMAFDAAYENHADYLDGNNRIIGNSRYNSQTLRFHTGINRENFKNKLSYTYLEQNLGIIEDDEMDDDESLATTRYDRKMQLPFQEVRDHVISYRQTTVHNKWVTSLNASYHINDRKEIEDDFDEVDLGLSQSHAFYNARVSHKTTQLLENTLGVQGAFLDNKNHTDAEEILIPNAQYIETGIYYLANLSLGSYLIQGGVRYDNRDVNAAANAPHIVEYGYNLPGNPPERKTSRNFSGWTGSLGLSKNIGEQNMIKLNLSSGFRAPDLAELFSNGPHPGTNRFEVGGNFDREQSYQADINWLFETKKFHSSLAFFGNMVDNYIFFSGTGISWITV